MTDIGLTDVAVARQQAGVDESGLAMARRWAALGAGTGIAVGLLALLGWLLSLAALKGLHPSWVSMRVNTAVGIVVLGLGLLAELRAAALRASRWPLAGRLAGLLVLLLGVLTLLQYGFDLDLGIDRLFYNEPSGDFGVSAPGRMAPLTAVCLALLGSSLLWPRQTLLRQLVVLLVGLTGLRVLLGYIYGVEVFYESPARIGVAANTAFAFCALALGLQCTLADSGIMRVLTGSRAGSIMARRLLPAMLLLPVLFEWLRLYGEKVGWFTTAFGTALTVLAGIGLLLLVALRTLALLNQREAADAGQTRLLESVLDSMGDGVAVADPSGRLVRFNRAAETLLGLGPNQGTAESWAGHYGIYHPDTMELFKPEESPMARALRGEQVDADELFVRNARRPEGLYISATARPIRDHRQVIVGGVVMFREVTEQRQSRQLLQEAGRYEQSRGAVLTLFNQGLERRPLLEGLLKLLASNHALLSAAFYGYDSWRDSFLLEVSHGAPVGLVQSFRAGEGLSGQAVLDNEPFMVETGASGLVLDLGFACVSPQAVLGVPVNHQDVRQGFLLVACTHVPTLADKEFLRHLCAQLGIALHNLGQYDNLRFLADQLRQRSEEIAEKNRELESASQMKSEFLANMSHELRTPLNAIIGFSEVLMDGLLGRLEERQKHSIKDIHDSGNHLLALINDILDLSKIEAGHMTLQLQPVDLGALLQNSLAIVREKAMRQHLALGIALPPEPVQISADPRRLKQIVYNLLSNAVKFTSEGGSVQITLEALGGAELERLAVDYRSAPAVAGARYVGISVSDTGIGIAPTDMQRLFQPFVQLDSSLSRQYNGTGLGLVMVKYLAEMHGGLVTVSSRQNEGSRFGVWLPLDVVAAATVLPVAAVRPAALIVEDDFRHAEMIRHALEDEGFETVHASDGTAALRALAQRHFELITLDLVMPGMDGWETLERLKAAPAAYGVPIVIISMVAEDNMRKGMSLGAYDVLQKPVDRAQLRALVQGIGLGGDDGRQRRVLVIDDDARNVDLLLTCLQDVPALEVSAAYDGQSGVEQALKQLPDLLIVDLMMPGMNGFEVVQALQKTPAAAAIPVIILTAKSLSAEERQQLERHVHGIFGKAQFTRKAFVNEVRRAMAHARPVAAEA